MYYLFNVFSNNLEFLGNIWSLPKLFWSALMVSSHYQHFEIVKLLLDQRGIDKNAKDIDLFVPIFL